MKRFITAYIALYDCSIWQAWKAWRAFDEGLKTAILEA